MAEVLAQPGSKSRFLEDMARIPKNGNPEWWTQLRLAGKSLFENTPYPHTKMEEWRQTNIAPIVNTEFRSITAPAEHGLEEQDAAPFLLGQGEWTELVFVDGFLASGLGSRAPLPEGVVVESLHAAMAGPHAETVRAHLGSRLGERNAYTALNTAFLQDGAFVHVPKGTALEQPLHLVFVTNREESETAAHIRNLVVLEESAAASIVLSYVSTGRAGHYLNNVVEEVVLGDNASLRYHKLCREGGEGNHLATTEVAHGRDSKLLGGLFTLGGKIVRNQVCAHLHSPGADCQLIGLYLAEGERLVDNFIDIRHDAEHCFSRIHCKGILEDRSKAVFAGKVFVDREAQKTDSEQLNNNLLLSDRAKVDTKPQLEIYADDVKCTHGATVGAPPEEVVFYFRSRGIGEQLARAMLTCGFADEIVDELEIEPLKALLEQYVFDKYSK